MPAKRLLPEITTMLSWRDVEGLTSQQIASRVNEQNRSTMSASEYRPVTRSAVAVALHRAGEAGLVTGLRTRERYTDLIPWSPIAVEHESHHARKMLRLAAREARGEVLPASAARSLETFRQMLSDQNCVIDYNPVAGFRKVRPRPGIDTGMIRVPAVTRSGDVKHG